MHAFGGFDMPIQYDSIFAEHLATRTDVGLFDISHMGRFAISGKGAVPFLQYVLTNNVLELQEVGTAQYTILPEASGAAVDDAYLYRTGLAEYMLVVNAASDDLGVYVDGAGFSDSGHDQPAGGSSWHHVAAVASDGETRMYVDGVYVGCSTGSVADNSLVFVGNWANRNRELFSEYLDEFRVSPVVRSPAWLWACCLNQGDGSLAAYGPAEKHDGTTTGSETDVDGDGLPDDWEERYFSGTGVTDGGPDEDWDGDGFPDYCEYVAGTDPTNAASLLLITDVLGLGSTGYVLRWPSVSNRIYGIDRATNLVEPGFAPVTGDIPASPPLNVYTDMFDGVPVFYRIDVRDQP